MIILNLSEHLTLLPDPEVVVLAGGYDGFSILDHVEVYSPDGRCQRTLASLPTPTYGAMLAYAGGMLLACGGQAPQGMVRGCYA